MTILYPYFLLFLFAPFILYFISQKKMSSGAWTKLCDAHLLPYLTVLVNAKSNRFYRYLMLACWIIGCFCLSGPAIEQKIPTATAQSGLVVVVDMSPAMQGEITSQMTRKLYDLLEYKKEATIGLVLSDDKAYVALPMTQDKSVFRNIIPDLKENIMPSVGQNLKDALEKASSLLKQSGFKKGQILLLTAGVVDSVDLLNSIQKSPYPVSVIGFGDKENKAPVVLTDGSFWGKQQPFMVGLSDLPVLLGNKYMHASLDETDLKRLLKNDNLEQIEQQSLSVVQYQNLGIWGLLILVPMVCLLFRKGVLFSFLLLLVSLPAQANLWWRTEQEIYQKQMQGIAEFNIGQYEKAYSSFERIADTDIDALYNLGNTLAYMGQIEKAIQTYEKVLSLYPAHQDAKYNLEYLKKSLPPPPPQQSQAGQSLNNQENNQDSSSDKNQTSQNEANASSQPENQENQQDKSSQSEDKEAENEQNQKEEQKQNSRSENQKEVQSTLVNGDNKEEEKQQKPQPITASEQKQKEWLDKIKPDAGRVLRYRLFRQYQEQK